MMTRRPPAVRRPPMDARIRARRQEVFHERARRRGRVAGSIVVLVLLVVAGVLVARSPLFSIADVRIAGVVGAQRDMVEHAAGLRLGDNLLSVDLGAAGDRVQALPWVRVAEARRLPPSGVELRVVLREPEVVVRLPDARWLVDREGVVVAGGTREGLIELTAPNSVVPGVGAQVRDAALRNALSVHTQIPDALRALVVRYEARSGRDLRLHLHEGIVVRFGVADDVAAKARSVMLLIDQARAQAARRVTPDEPGAGLGVAEIDVRAPDNPVLVPVVGE